MAYRVEITPEAEADLDQSYCYFARDSRKNALRWWQRFYDVVARLSQFPEAYGPARENDAVPFDVR
jgi:plasmid stabilization system protein ParE